MKRIFDCKCGYHIDVSGKTRVLKILKEHEITIKLFGLPCCKEKIKKLIKGETK